MLSLLGFCYNHEVKVTLYNCAVTVNNIQPRGQGYQHKTVLSWLPMYNSYRVVRVTKRKLQSWLLTYSCVVKAIRTQRQGQGYQTQTIVDKVTNIKAH